MRTSEKDSDGPGKGRSFGQDDAMLRNTIALTLAAYLPNANVAIAGVRFRLAEADASLSPGLQSGDKGFTYDDGHRDGGQFAEVDGGSSFGAGLLTGLLTGPIGVLIGYHVVGPKKIEPSLMQRLDSKGTDYRQGFKESWDRTSRGKKRGSFRIGGIVGAGMMIALLLVIENASEDASKDVADGLDGLFDRFLDSFPYAPRRQTDLRQSVNSL